jgi:hypothetical protein
MRGITWYRIPISEKLAASDIGVRGRIIAMSGRVNHQPSHVPDRPFMAELTKDPAEVPDKHKITVIGADHGKDASNARRVTQWYSAQGKSGHDARNKMIQVTILNLIIEGIREGRDLFFPLFPEPSITTGSRPEAYSGTARW